MGKILDELRPSFGHEKWFKNAEKREKVKTDGQRELDRNLFEECLNGNSEEALRLLDEGATNDYQNGFGRSPLHAACSHGLLDVAKEIEKRFPGEIHRRTTFGWTFGWHHYTPLGDAFFGNHENIIIWLFEIGAKNYIHNVLNYPTKRNLDLINSTGNVLNYIDEDINQCVNLLMSYTATIGLGKIMYYYKDDKIMIYGIVKILNKFNLPSDNKYAYLEKMADLFGHEPWMETENKTEKTYFQYIIDYE